MLNYVSLLSLGLLIPENQFLAASEPEEGFKLFDYQPPGPAVWSN
jgi:hypothetical protein